MAEYPITAISVPLPLGDSSLIAGEAIDAGEVIYIKASDGKAYLAYSTATAAEANAKGFATCSAGAGQPVFYNALQVMTVNTGLGVTTYYFLASTPGAMELETDIAAGDLEYKTLLAVGLSATELWPHIWASGITKP